MNAPDPIIEYITDRRKRGFSDQAIIAELVNGGWSADQASQTMARLGAAAVSSLPKPRRMIYVGLAGMAIVVVAGALYWFVLRQEKPDTTPANNRNQPVATANTSANTNTAATFAQVFSVAVSREEFNRYKHYIDTIPDTDSFIAVPSFESNPETTVSMFLEPYVYQEAIKRLGGSLGSFEEIAVAVEQSITSEQKAAAIAQMELPAELWSDYVHYSMVPQKLRFELAKLIGDKPAAVFQELGLAHVNLIREATEHRIAYLKLGDMEFIQTKFGVRDYYGEADPNYLNKNFSDDLVTDLPLPADIKNNLLQNRNNPLVVTPVVAEGGYHIFGFVLPPLQGLPVPEKFTKADIVALRFPWADEPTVNGEYAVALLWETGVEQGNIVLTKQSDLAMPPVGTLIDFDGDGLKNYIEGVYGTRYNEADTDKDGKTDKQEYDSGTDPLKV